MADRPRRRRHTRWWCGVGSGLQKNKGRERCREGERREERRNEVAEVCVGFGPIYRPNPTVEIEGEKKKKMNGPDLKTEILKQKQILENNLNSKNFENQ